MKITLNGEQREFGGVATIGDLLDAIGLAGKPVVVEHNEQPLFPREIVEVRVADGDVIEIVQVTAGG